MPHYGHHADIFVVYTWATEDERVIEAALERVSDECRWLIAGPVGGINGYKSLALLPSGGTLEDRDAHFTELHDALGATVGTDNVEYVRIRFGEDDERAFVLDSTYPWDQPPAQGR